MTTTTTAASDALSSIGMKEEGERKEEEMKEEKVGGVGVEVGCRES